MPVAFFFLARSANLPEGLYILLFSCVVSLLPFTSLPVTFVICSEIVVDDKDGRFVAFRQRAPAE